MNIRMDLIHEWDYERNWKEYKVSYMNMFRESKMRVWWVCKTNVCGCHRWKDSVHNRSLGKDCPYCAGRRACIHTSLQTLYPNLANEWDTKLNKLGPDKISVRSGKRAWWKCKNVANVVSGVCGCHKWRGTISNRIMSLSMGYHDCPYCSGMMACKHSCLQTTHPELAREWSNKNTLKPDKITAGYRNSVYWVCKHATCMCHVWKDTIFNRTKGKGCEVCSGSRMCTCTVLKIKDEVVEESHDRDADDHVQESMICSYYTAYDTWAYSTPDGSIYSV